MYTDHQLLSWMKSGIRIIGLGLLPLSILLGAVVLIVAEGVGILEEVGESTDSDRGSTPKWQVDAFKEVDRERSSGSDR